MNHAIVETKIGLMGVLIAIVISFGGLVEIVPLFFSSEVTEPAEGIEPYDALELAGRDIYIREGCYVCHSQMIRPFRSETERYGHYSVAGEFVYDRPFQWGSKRTGPDLHRVGGLYSDDWHRVHMINPRDVVPESIMPGYPWLADNMIDGSNIQTKMKTLRTLGAPGAADLAARLEYRGRDERRLVLVFKVAALKDSTSQKFVESNVPKAELIKVKSYDDALDMLIQDKITAIIADYPFCAFAAFRYRDKDLVAGQSRLTFEPLGIAVQPDTLLLNWLRNFLIMLDGSGQLKLLSQKWFENGDWIKELPQKD